MNALLWIGNGRAVLPDRIDENGSVLIDNGVIAAVGCACPEGAARVDAGGGYILPGFIDIHVHGGGNADFMDATPESFETVARAHAVHGTTALVATTMTCPDPLLERVIGCCLRAGRTPANGAEILGLHLEGPYFSSAGRGAQPVTEQRVPDRGTLEHMLALAQGRILRWDAAPELPQMQLFAQVMREHGVLCAIAHTQADATQTTQAFDWGFRHVTHFYNATTTFHKKNSIVHAGVVEATYIRDDVTIELIGDGRHIPKESMQLAWRIKGADNIALITDAMRAAGTNDVVSVLGPREGGVPVVIKDDVAQLTDLSSYAGSICTMDRALRVAHRQYGLPLIDVSRMLSLTPARLCGCADRKGSLEPGKDADAVVLSPELDVRSVVIRGIPV